MNDKPDFAKEMEVATKGVAEALAAFGTIWKNKWETVFESFRQAGLAMEKHLQEIREASE